MRFTILPRPKRVTESEGVFSFDTLRIFVVYERNHFFPHTEGRTSQ